MGYYHIPSSSLYHKPKMDRMVCGRRASDDSVDIFVPHRNRRGNDMRVHVSGDSDGDGIQK